MVEGRLIKKGKALDLCSGTGANAMYLAKKGFEVTGVDLSSQAVEFRKKEAKREKIPITLTDENFLELPFEDEKFDFIYDMGCFHHIRPEYRIPFIKRVTRVLKTGGSYLLITLSQRNGPGGNHFTQRELLSYFSGDFKLKIVKHVPSLESEGKTQYFYAFLLEKK